MVNFRVEGAIVQIKELEEVVGIGRKEKIYLVRVEFDNDLTRIKTKDGIVPLSFNERHHLMVGDYISANCFTRKEKQRDSYVTRNRVRHWQVAPLEPLHNLEVYAKRALLNKDIRQDRKIPGDEGTSKIYWSTIARKVKEFLRELKRSYRTSGEDCLENYITHLATQTHEKYRSPPTIYPFDLEEIRDFLWFWHHHWNKRRLSVLGLSWDRYDCPLTTDDIWQRCQSNPDSLIIFKEEKIKTVRDRLLQDDGDYDKAEDPEDSKLLYNIGNYLWDELDNGHTWVDLKIVENRFHVDLEELFAECDPSDYFLLLDKDANKVVLTIERQEVEYILENIGGLLNSEPYEVDATYMNTLREDGFLSSDQLEALQGSLKSRVCIITGAAGTGKTTLTKYIIDAMENVGRCLVTTSFMGKACNRLNRLTDGKAKARTMHSLLSSGDMWDFSGTVIIDEAGTVSQTLLSKFLYAYGENIEQLVLIGDVNQLRPIKWGNPFEALYKSKKIPIYSLTNIHRQSAGQNAILRNAHKIIRGTGVVELEEGEDFSFLSGGIDIIQTMARYIKEGNSNSRPFENIRVITPCNREVNEINNTLQDILCQDRNNVHMGKNGHFYVGDPIIVGKNSKGDVSGAEMFNGMEGYIRSFVHNTMDNLKEGKHYNGTETNQEPRHWAEVVLDSGEIEYIVFPKTKGEENDDHYDIGVDSGPENNVKRPILPGKRITMDNISPCYALTMDKAQGSEWENVWVYITKDSKPNPRFLNKNRLYVAVTRARKLCICIGGKQKFCRTAGTCADSRCGDFEYQIRNSNWYK